VLAPEVGIGLEERLILELVGSRLAPPTGQGTDTEPDGVDWGRLVAVARAHGVLPLVRQALSEGFVPELASDDRAAIDRAADAATRRSLLMTSSLLSLLAELSSAGITAVPWKGPVLAELLWSDVGMRQYADLDLLVRHADLERSRDLLLERGFRRAVPQPAWQEASYVERVGVVELVRDSDALVVEVHWTVVPSYFSSAMDPEGIWQRLEQATIARRTIMTLAPEDLLIALSIHGFKHRWERLGWIVDVARLLQVRPGMDWAGLQRRTKRDGSRRLVRIAVGVATEMFGRAVPIEARAALGDDETATRIVEEIASAVLRRLPVGHSAEAPVLHARARERRRDRLAYFLTALTTSTRGDWATMPVPARLSGVYRLVRPVRLLVRYINHVRRGA